MKLELIRRSMRNDYVCYGVKISESKIWKIYIPRMAMRWIPTERMVVFVSMSSVDESKHICHTCQRQYPRGFYAKHAKRFH
jgi:hypothetical protein